MTSPDGRRAEREMLKHKKLYTTSKADYNINNFINI